MRDRILIKSPVDIPQEGGGAISTYQTVIQDWTKILPFSSSRQEVDSQINLEQGFRFYIRDRTNIVVNKKMLVQYNSKDYTINRIEPIKNRHRWLLITAITNDQPYELPV